MVKVSQYGEFRLLDRIERIVSKSRRSAFPAWQNLVLGIGDDAAVWRRSQGDVLATVDCLVQGVHFDLETFSWSDLGWKSLAVNLSDIAAMGGSPEYVLVSLGLPTGSGVRNIDAFYETLTSLASDFQAAVAGGNLSSAPFVFASVTVTGRAGGHLLRRGAAAPGDAIAVTGCLGTASAGRRLLSNKSGRTEHNAPLIQAFLRPCPRLETGRFLVEAGIRCAIDVSDGLVGDLGHICRRSGVGAEIDVSRVPVLPAVSGLFGAEALQLALAGGEDYELLFTGPVEKLNMVAAHSPYPVSIIGSITPEHPGEIRLTGADGSPFLLGAEGWQHFESCS
jgi:thiamine-monophosphate kinase